MRYYASSFVDGAWAGTTFEDAGDQALEQIYLELQGLGIIPLW